MTSTPPNSPKWREFKIIENDGEIIVYDESEFATMEPELDEGETLYHLTEVAALTELQAEIERLNAIVNSPEKFDLKEHLDLQRRHARLNAEVEELKKERDEFKAYEAELYKALETDVNDAANRFKKYQDKIARLEKDNGDILSSAREMASCLNDVIDTSECECDDIPEYELGVCPRCHFLDVRKRFKELEKYRSGK